MLQLLDKEDLQAPSEIVDLLVVQRATRWAEVGEPTLTGGQECRPIARISDQERASVSLLP